MRQKRVSRLWLEKKTVAAAYVEDGFIAEFTAKGEDKTVEFVRVADLLVSRRLRMWTRS